MDLIHFRTMFPRFLPFDIIDIIYYLIGRRAPTYEIMSEYILSISSHFKKMREGSSTTSYFYRSNDEYDFNASVDTLWNATFWWHFPKFLNRNAELHKLTRAEVDLTIAYHQLQQTICDSKIKKSTAQNEMTMAIEEKREWHEGHISDLQDHLSQRAKNACLEMVVFEDEFALH
jgi:hypothetical protein